MRNAVLLLVLASAVAPAAPAATPARNYFSDVVLLNQDGREMRLYSDVLQGNTVVVESFFSTCSGTCPIMNATFSKLQKAFADRLGKDLFLVSITVDSERDTPERLKAYARKVGARPGWVFLTGTKENVARALHKFGLQTPAPEQHKNIFLVGNERHGLWKKVFGLAKSDEIIGIVRGVANDDGR